MSSAIPSTSTLNKIPKVVIDRKLKDRSGKIVNSQVTVPAHQLSNLDHTEIVYSQSMKGVPKNLFRNAGAKFSATLEQKSFTKMLSATIRIQTTHDAAGEILTVCPLTYWFNRIEFRCSDGSKHLNIVYDDNLHFAMCTSENNVYQSTKQLIGTTGVLYQMSLRDSDTHYLPLLGSWFENADLWFRNIEGDIVVNFYPRSNLHVGASEGAINVESMEFVIQTEELSEQDMHIQTRFHNQFAAEHNFLDIIPVNFYGFKLQAGVTSKFELDAVNGDVAFLVMYVNAQSPYSPAQHILLGDGTRVDVLSPGSKSLLGSGTGIELEYLRSRVLATHIHNDFFLNHPQITVIPFCSSVSKSIFGVKSGSMYFDGSRYYLSVTPQDIFTTGVYDVVIYAYKFSTLLNNKGRLSIHSS